MGSWRRREVGAAGHPSQGPGPGLPRGRRESGGHLSQVGGEELSSTAGAEALGLEVGRWPESGGAGEDSLSHLEKFLFFQSLWAHPLWLGAKVPSQLKEPGAIFLGLEVWKGCQRWWGKTRRDTWGCSPNAPAEHPVLGSDHRGQEL